MPKKGSKKGEQKIVPKIPADLAQAADYLQEVAEVQRQLTRIQTDLNEEVARLQAQALTDAKKHQDELLALAAGLYQYAESNRESLLRGDSKTVRLATGTLSWRTTPPKVNFRSAEKLVERLKQEKLTEFIRTIEEPDKEAMLKEPGKLAGIRGVSITQDEIFYIKPNEIEIEIKAGAKKISLT